MFEGFRTEKVDVEGVRIKARVAGIGPPLLHGNPQTHAMWYLVGPKLAENFEDQPYFYSEYRSPTRRGVAL